MYITLIRKHILNYRYLFEGMTLKIILEAQNIQYD